jgi:hypothetical protein
MGVGGRIKTLLPILGAHIKLVKYADTKYIGCLRLCTVIRVMHDNDKSVLTHIHTIDAARLITSEIRYTYSTIVKAITHQSKTVQHTIKAMPKGFYSINFLHHHANLGLHPPMGEEDMKVLMLLTQKPPLPHAYHALYTYNHSNYDYKPYNTSPYDTSTSHYNTSTCYISASRIFTTSSASHISTTSPNISTTTSYLTDTHIEEDC